MRTVSCEMAKKLKDAGLRWEPKENDVVLALDHNGRELAFMVLPPRIKYVDQERNLWLPTLPDLLEWLEGRGYGYTLSCFEYRQGPERYEITLWKSARLIRLSDFEASTLEDSAAKAVLWVLEQEGRGSINA